jgi:hypothetical protein
VIGPAKIRRALFVIFISLFASVIFSQQRPEATTQQSPRVEVHVLFIGNSFTYFNNMPRIVEAISETVDGPRIKTEMVAIGGARLEDLWKQGSALAAIRKQHWDFVVMNEQSALGGGKVNGEKRIGDPGNFFKYAEMFDTEIRKAGAKTVIMMTWKDKKDPDQIQNELNKAFVEFKNKMHGGPILAPVSVAWRTTKLIEPEIDLYFADNHHPSKEGSYLTACTVYAALTQHSPKGAAAKIRGTPIDNERGTVFAGKTRTLVDLSPRIAFKLQWIASQSAIPLPQFEPPKLKNAPVISPAFQQNKQPAHLIHLSL